MQNLREVPSYIPKNLIFDFDIYHDPRIGEDVQLSYETLHRDAPDVFYTSQNGGHWMIMRHDIIAEIVRDYEHFSAAEMAIPRVENPPVMIPLNVDPPRNLPYRQALTPTFTPKAIGDMEGKIRGWAAKIIGEVADKGECDFIQDVSALFPVSVFMELMGLPLDRLREFRDLANSFFVARSAEDIHRVSQQVYAIMGERIEYLRANPGNNLMTRLTQVNIEGKPMPLEDILNMCFVIFLGGMDTVTNVIGFSFRMLAQMPDLQKRLAENPKDISKFIDEGLRCFGVVNTPRLVAKDCDKFGAPFRAGDMVLCCLPMAGRDDRMNPDPNAFNIDRENPVHLTFSVGPHVCVGQGLAKSEMRILTEEWLKRIPSFKLVPGTKYRSRLGAVMSLDNLPLKWKV